MSHIVEIDAEIRDADALRLACRRNKLAAPVQGTAKLFSSEATGYLVHLPRWRYPVVCDTDSGNVAYDNYEGHWGDQSDLDKLLQSYSTEKCKLEARRQGHTVTEQTLSNGSIKLTVCVGE
ncbi:hypothetical protein Mal33_13170 [Rosistilla oblonga]|uniref:DUF1257 domain-containing protein n=1 Tax=Rosistilla oblonga TaxID=2527990 RepID=A0A518IQH4_9BACT|nr:hypothetical protein [Rosistilla oblonga]QDV55346.1 hypothetical protein Mal33_13170 [Rosistilla oblonga]